MVPNILPNSKSPVTGITWSNSAQIPGLFPPGSLAATALHHCERQQVVLELSQDVQVIRGQHRSGAVPRSCWQARGRKEMQHGSAGG